MLISRYTIDFMSNFQSTASLEEVYREGNWSVLNNGQITHTHVTPNLATKWNSVVMDFECVYCKEEPNEYLKVLSGFFRL